MQERLFKRSNEKNGARKYATMRMLLKNYVQSFTINIDRNMRKKEGGCKEKKERGGGGGRGN